MDDHENGMRYSNQRTLSASACSHPMVLGRQVGIGGAGSRMGDA